MRHLFAGESPVVLRPPTGQNFTAVLYPGAPFSVWDSLTGGTDISSQCTAADGVSAPTLAADANGIWKPFRGPDGNPDGPALVWLDFGGPDRIPCRAVDIIQYATTQAQAAADSAKQAASSAATSAGSASAAQSQVQALIAQYQAGTNSGSTGGGISQSDLAAALVSSNVLGYWQQNSDGTWPKRPALPVVIALVLAGKPSAPAPASGQTNVEIVQQATS